MAQTNTFSPKELLVEKWYSKPDHRRLLIRRYSRDGINLRIDPSPPTDSMDNSDNDSRIQIICQARRLKYNRTLNITTNLTPREQRNRSTPYSIIRRP